MAELVGFEIIENVDNNFFGNVRDVLAGDALVFPDDSRFARFTLNDAGTTRPVIRDYEPEAVWKRRQAATEVLKNLFTPLIELGRDYGHLQGIDAFVCDADVMVVTPGVSHRGADASRWHVDYVHDYRVWDELVLSQGSDVTTEIAVGSAAVNIVMSYGISKEAHRTSIHNMDSEVTAGIAQGELTIVRPESEQLIACPGVAVHRSPINRSGESIDRTFIRIMPADAHQPISVKM